MIYPRGCGKKRQLACGRRAREVCHRSLLKEKRRPSSRSSWPPSRRDEKSRMNGRRSRERPRRRPGARKPYGETWSRGPGASTRGARSAARCSVPIVIKSQVVLEVGAKISFENTTTTSTKTTRKLDSLAKFTRPKVKDYATDGADFNGERLVVAACVPRSSAHLRVSVYERLKTDLVKTRRLGIATIPLDEVPVLSAPLTGVSRRSVGAFLSNLRARRHPRGAIWSGSSNRYCMRRHELYEDRSY